MSRRKHRSDTPVTPLTVLSQATTAPTDPQHPRRNYARWRAFTLMFVYVLFAIHIIHWKLNGTTLAPLELNEVMYTLELGIITAGFIFMAALFLGTAIFGRFFCSWGCHIMALQDACSWLLRKLRIRPKQMRSRLLLLVPPLTAFYMFLWPQVLRVWHGQALPRLHFATDADGWASLATTNFWRNLPGPWIIAITFFICGFAIVYLLGSRSFCTYVCPYGAIFAFADRFSPGRIRVDDSCKQCGRCTGVCSSGVRVHEEIREHGMIVNPACLKDLDCISVCPQQALSYGLAKPALYASRAGGSRFGIPYDFTLREEVLGAAAFLITLLSFRGLYGYVPFLLALALGAIAAYVTMALLRLATKAHVSVASFQIKRAGRLTFSGAWFLPAAFLAALSVAHSGFIRFHEYTGLRAGESLRRIHDSSQRTAAAELGFARLAVAERWSLFTNPRVERARLGAAEVLHNNDAVESHATRILRDQPEDADVRLSLARSLMRQDRVSEAVTELRRIVNLSAGADGNPSPELFPAYAMLASIYASQGQFDWATEHYALALALQPASAKTRAGYGAALAEMGRLEDAIQQLQEATRQDASLYEAGYNLGTLLMHLGRNAEAVASLRKVIDRYADDADALNNFGLALAREGVWAEAESYLRRTVDLEPRHSNAHFNLARLLVQLDRPLEAQKHLQRAADLDPRYAAMLREPGR